MAVICCILTVLAGYLIGTINPAYLLGRKNGFDIRKRGSGNAGASNAMISFGFGAGVACALFDILKAFFAVFFAGRVIFPMLPTMQYLTVDRLCAAVGVACILGHVFPVFMGFRGGKGLSCLAGVVIAFDWRVFLIMLGVAAMIVLLTRYLCLVSISASAALPVVYGILRSDLVGALIYAIAGAVIICKHLVNIKRIFKGTELKIDSIWNRKKSLDAMKERIKENTGEIPAEDEVSDYLLK